MSLTSEITVKYTATETAPADLGSPRFQPLLEKAFQFANGTTANKADLQFTDERTIAASSDEDLDMAGGLTDQFGNTITMTEIVAILVVADSANTNDVVIGNGTAPVVGGPFGASGTNVINIPPGGVFVWAVSGDGDGIAVTGTTADEIGVANSSSGTGVTYKIVVLGRSA